MHATACGRQHRGVQRAAHASPLVDVPLPFAPLRRRCTVMPAVPRLHELANGTRLLLLAGPWRTACVSVFVASGSAHEAGGENGISHVVEHMAFKGTSTRSAQRINRDAELLGAEVNAHTDKDHTAYQMRGRVEDVLAMTRMLAEIVCDSQFPEDELERERQVLLQEVAEDADDAVSTTFKLFDRACFGLHPVAAPVIGSASRIRRFGRGELLAFVRRQYSGSNVIVAVALPASALDAATERALQREAEAGFATLPRGEPHRLPAAAYCGGVRTRSVPGSSQAHLVLGWALPPLAEEDPAATLAAAVLGEGMSSPLLDELRERRGLVYHAAASADVLAVCGQFVVEASCGSADLLQVLDLVRNLLLRHAGEVPAAELERARALLAVRRLHDEERPMVRIERAALDLFALGRVRPAAERDAADAEVTTAAVRDALQRALAGGLAVAVGGSLPRAASVRVREVLGELVRTAA
jgi:predicted Zn-dependent peptidase